MAKRRKQITYFNYECTITGERYRLTKKAKNPDELISIDAFYQLNPEKDDRTAAVKKRLGVEEETIEEKA